MKVSWSKLMVFGLMFGCLGIGSAFGAGFQLYNEGSAEAVGLAGAISARRDMISNAWYNPASVTDFKESRLMLGVTAVNLRSDYCTNVGAGGDTDATLENKWSAIPNFYYIHPMCESLALSLSFNMPYGLATSWDWQNNTIGPQVSEMISLKPFYLSPSVSYAVTDKLSVAAGINIVYATAMLRKFVAYPAPITAFSRDMKLEADSWGYGYMLGGNYKMNEEWTVAAKYQSPVYLKLMGEANYLPNDPGAFVGPNKGVEADLTLPQTVTLGIANKSIEKWTFGADVLWTNWSQYDKLAFTFEDTPAPGAASGTLGAQKNWNDVFSYRLSAEYELTEAWKLRFGYEYDDSPVPDATRSPDMPDSDRNVLAIGLTYDRANWGVDLAYSIAFFETSDANPKSPDLNIPGGASSDQLNGDYRNTMAHLVSAAYRYKF